MNFTGGAIVAGVAGWPIKHSRSPRIHNYWLRQYGIDGVYVPFAMPAEGAREAIRMLPSLGIRGLNVTVPHKEQAYKAMDEVDRWAQRMKAVNTIAFWFLGLSGWVHFSARTLLSLRSFSSRLASISRASRRSSTTSKSIASFG